MKKRSRVGGLINEVRKTLDVKSQVEFARLLGTTPPTISRWEAGKVIPPADVMIKLAVLAPNPDHAIRFLVEAGADRQAILRMAQRISEEVKAAILPQEIIESLMHGERQKAAERLALTPLPAGVAPYLGPDLGPASYLIINSEFVGGMYGDGQIVIVDSDVKDPQDPQPFWRQIVLAEFPPYEERDDGAGVQWRQWPEKSFFVGHLKHKVSARHAITWLAILECSADSKDDWMPGDDGACIGGWLYKTPNMMQFSALDAANARGEAPAKIRLYKGCRILGSVVSSWRPRKAGK
jgi:transcriptional regulator with XRE-family HTH domain